jgi:transcriptional regulator with XRE-family HTH domain
VKLAERIESYLAASGWTKAELAKRANVSPSTITRLLHGRKDRGASESYELGELVAMKLERATLDAFTRGEVKAAPLRAMDLLADEAA